MSNVGHNQPPDMTATAGETCMDLSGWMAENPIIQTEEQAREAKVFIDRGSNCVKDLEAERTGKVSPLNEQVKKINDYYRGPRELLERVVDELKRRMDKFLLKEEEKRIAAAEALRLAAEAAEQAARDAERMEGDALANAEAGELDVSVMDAVAEADRKFAAAQKAERQAQVAERDTRVRIGGGFTRALSLRNKETLRITNLVEAVTAMQDSEKIREVVIKAAASYKKVYGKLPPGIEAHVERRI